MPKWRRKPPGAESKRLLCWLPVMDRMGGRTTIPFSATRKRIKEKIEITIIISAISVAVPGVRREGKAPRLRNNRKKRKRKKRRLRRRKKNLKLLQPLLKITMMKNPRRITLSPTHCRWSTAVSAGCRRSTASGRSAATTSTSAKSGSPRPTPTSSNKSTRQPTRPRRKAKTLPRIADSGPRRRKAG